jgi:hypothetical protein
MIDECEQEEMDFLNVELNWWVDTGISRFPLSLSLDSGYLSPAFVDAKFVSSESGL